MQDKRKFHRVLFDTTATLTIADTHYSTRILDLSLKGALIDAPKGYTSTANTSGLLHFDLGNEELRVEMEVELSHINDNHLGLHCIRIDIDSITTLRRIIELNLMGNDMLERDIHELIVESE